MTAQEKLSVMSLSFENVIFLRETFAWQRKMKHFSSIVEKWSKGVFTCGGDGAQVPELAHFAVLISSRVNLYEVGLAN
jgi:hypothetical protein